MSQLTIVRSVGNGVNLTINIDNIEEGEAEKVIDRMEEREGINIPRMEATPRCFICKRGEATYSVPDGLDFDDVCVDHKTCHTCHKACIHASTLNIFSIDKEDIEEYAEAPLRVRAGFANTILARARYLEKNGDRLVARLGGYQKDTSVECYGMDFATKFSVGLIKRDFTNILKLVEKGMEKWREKADAVAQALLAEEEANAGAGAPKKRRRRKKAKKITKIKTKIVEETRYDIIGGVRCVRKVKKTITIRR